MILVIIGKSGSGKSTLAKYLEKHYGYKRLVTYTTRPKREGEIDGVDYNFISKEDFLNLEKSNFFAETAMYKTTFGDVYYGSALLDYINSSPDENTLIVLNPIGLKQLMERNIPHESLYLYMEESEILKRLSKRGDIPKEVERRLLTDREDFYWLDAVVNNKLIINRFSIDIIYRVKEGIQIGYPDSHFNTMLSLSKIMNDIEEELSC